MYNALHQRMVIILLMLLGCMAPSSYAVASTSFRDVPASDTPISNDFGVDYAIHLDGGLLLEDFHRVITELDQVSDKVQPATEEISNVGLENRHRELIIGTVPCNGGAGPLYNFTIDFKIKEQGGWDLSGCSSTEKMLLGAAINAFLLDYGIGDAGVGDKIAFLGEVCINPAVNRRRKLAYTWSFRFQGGGNCRFCLVDNFDSRRRLPTSSLRGSDEQVEERRLQTETDPNWFRNVFKPEMQNRLVNAFINYVAPFHKTCLGNGPIVTVVINSTGMMPNTCQTG